MRLNPNTIKPKNLAVVLLPLFLLVSCNKSTSKRGCTDWESENYESSATIDCQCCYYFGKIYLWYEYDFYDTKIRNKVSVMKYYLNGELVGQTSGYIPSSISKIPQNDYNSYSDYNPEDKKNVIIRDLGKNKTEPCTLTITSESNNIIWYGQVTILANKIVQVQLM